MIQACLTGSTARSIRDLPALGILFAGWFDHLATQARAANLGCYPTGIFGTVPEMQTAVPPEQPLLPTTPAWNCIGNRYNCGHFKTCEELMSYWNACPGDPSRLDGDNDGIPCESMSCEPLPSPAG
jgi:hypothetical protein